MAELHPMLFPLYQNTTIEDTARLVRAVGLLRRMIRPYAERIRQEGEIDEANLLGTVLLMLGVAQDHLEMALEQFRQAQLEAEKRAT